MKKTKYPEIYENEQKLYTKNLVPGTVLFGESLLKLDGTEYRHFDPTRSKLAASIMKKIRLSGVGQGDVMLYLGASHGYTVSFLSDIVGQKGLVFAVDAAYKVFRSLYHVSNIRHNVVPLYADAAKPEAYARNICAVDVVYQDIAQKEQGEIFDANYTLYAKEGGIGILVVKARNIDVAGQPQKIVDGVKKWLISKGYAVIDTKSLEPYQHDHALILVTKGEIKHPPRTNTVSIGVPQKNSKQ